MSAITDRSEDLRWMAQHFEIPKEAARRLGISQATLRKWCERNDPEAWRLLKANESKRGVFV